MPAAERGLAGRRFDAGESSRHPWDSQEPLRSTIGRNITDQRDLPSAIRGLDEEEPATRGEPRHDGPKRVFDFMVFSGSRRPKDLGVIPGDKQLIMARSFAQETALRKEPGAFIEEDRAALGCPKRLPISQAAEIERAAVVGEMITSQNFTVVLEIPTKVFDLFPDAIPNQRLTAQIPAEGESRECPIHHSFRQRVRMPGGTIIPRNIPDPIDRQPLEAAPARVFRYPVAIPGQHLRQQPGEAVEGGEVLLVSEGPPPWEEPSLGIGSGHDANGIDSTRGTPLVPAHLRSCRGSKDTGSRSLASPFRYGGRRRCRLSPRKLNHQAGWN